MNPVFPGQRQGLCINVLNHERDHGPPLRRDDGDGHGGNCPHCWQKDPLGQPVLKDALASLEGEIGELQTIGTHLWFILSK